MAFATWDPSRKGSGVTLSGGNLTAAISGLYMVAATNPITISGSTGYYAEFTSLSTGGGTFMGIGIASAASLVDTYLGAYSNQYSMWEDGSDDTGGGITRNGNLWNYASSKSAGIKIAVANNKLWIGKIGTGWRNPNADDFTANPAANDTHYILTGFAATTFSLAVSSISSQSITANFGASSWIDTPPTGFVGFPGAGGTTVNLTGTAATGSAGSLKAKWQKALSGTAITGSAGTARASPRIFLLGSASSSALGSVTKRVVVALTGDAIASASGALGPAAPVTVSLTGSAASTGIGTLAASARKLLTGLAVTGAAGQWAPGRASALTGAAVTLSRGSLGPRITRALSGSQAALTRGSFSPQVKAYPDGVEGTFFTGALQPPGTVTVSLNGSEVTAGSGVFAAQHRSMFAGQSADAAAGTFGLSRSAVLAGRSATISGGAFGARIAHALTGTAAAFAEGAFTAWLHVSLSGVEIELHQGSFMNRAPAPVLRSITVSNAGSTMSLSVSNIATICTTSLTDLNHES